ncbi:MAG: bifunctional hydroxymethylpyrimidine kinase/phosphomethylpyrimidine kinase [Collinsella sp.]
MDRSKVPAVLSIAGSDSSGGAGIQADIKTITAHRLYAETAITAITAQNTLGVTAVQNISPDIVAAQIDAVFDDIRPSAVKIGMVSSVEIIEVIADRLSAWNATNVVVDPSWSPPRALASLPRMPRGTHPPPVPAGSRHHAQHSRGHGTARLRSRFRAHAAKCRHASHPPLWMRVSG